jgi:hypothetical protein
MVMSTLSKHVQTIVVSLATGALAWVAFSIQELKVEVAVLSEKVSQLESRKFVSSQPLVPYQPFLPRIKVHALPANYNDYRTRK